MSESQNIEWKQSWHDDYLKWICGFANAIGGVIYIGKNDNGEVVHLENYQRLLEDIPNKIRNQMGIICDVQLLEEEGNKYIQIKVNPYTVPVSLRGRYYYRTGSVKIELTGMELNEFLLKKAGKTWDDVVEENASFTDIDPKSVAFFKKEAFNSGRSPQDIIELPLKETLEKLRLANGDSIKRAAIILFGKDPNKFYPNIKVKIGRFGTTDADLRFQEVLEGNILELLVQVPEMLNAKFLIKPIVFEGLQRIEKEVYPVAAIREMLLNALVHRTYMGSMVQIRVYDDKLTLWNEGNLPEGMTVESLKRHHVSRPRNPLIADVCFKAGYIDSWGRGTIKIFEACKEAGLPEPEITSLDGGILVTLHKHTNDQVNDQANDQANDQVENKLKSSYDALTYKITKLLYDVKSPTENQYAKYIKISNTITEEEIQILHFCRTPKSNKEIQEECLGLKKHTDNFKKYIEPLLKNGALKRTLPHVPSSPVQKYFITNAGKIILFIAEEEKNTNK